MKATEPKQPGTRQTLGRMIADGSPVRVTVKAPDKRLKELFALPSDWASGDAVRSCIL